MSSLSRISGILNINFIFKECFMNSKKLKLLSKLAVSACAANALSVSASVSAMENVIDEKLEGMVDTLMANFKNHYINRSAFGVVQDMQDMQDMYSKFVQPDLANILANAVMVQQPICVLVNNLKTMMQPICFEESQKLIVLVNKLNQFKSELEKINSEEKIEKNISSLVANLKYHYNTNRQQNWQQGELWICYDKYKIGYNVENCLVDFIQNKQSMNNLLLRLRESQQNAVNNNDLFASKKIAMLINRLKIEFKVR